MPDTSAHVSILSKLYANITGSELRQAIGIELNNGLDDFQLYLDDLATGIRAMATAIKDQSNGS